MVDKVKAHFNKGNLYFGEFNKDNDQDQQLNRSGVNPYRFNGIGWILYKLGFAYKLHYYNDKKENGVTYLHRDVFDAWIRRHKTDAGVDSKAIDNAINQKKLEEAIQTICDNFVQNVKGNQPHKKALKDERQVAVNGQENVPIPLPEEEKTIESRLLKEVEPEIVEKILMLSESLNHIANRAEKILLLIDIKSDTDDIKKEFIFTPQNDRGENTVYLKNQLRQFFHEIDQIQLKGNMDYKWIIFSKGKENGRGGYISKEYSKDDNKEIARRPEGNVDKANAKNHFSQIIQNQWGRSPSVLDCLEFSTETPTIDLRKVKF